MVLKHNNLVGWFYVICDMTKIKDQLTLAHAMIVLIKYKQYPPQEYSSKQ